MLTTRLHFIRASVCASLYSQYGMVPEDTDGFGALLSGDQAKLHSDGFVQRVLQQLIVVVHCDTDHRRVDDWTLRHAKDISKIKIKR